jgi:hypothetical protein
VCSSGAWLNPERHENNGVRVGGGHLLHLLLLHLLLALAEAQRYEDPSSVEDFDFLSSCSVLV